MWAAHSHHLVFLHNQLVSKCLHSTTSQNPNSVGWDPSFSFTLAKCMNLQNWLSLKLFTSKIGIILVPGSKDSCENDLNINPWGGDLQDGRRVRRGDHLPPHKYIKNTSTSGTAPTEHLLNAGRRPQTSQKARKSPRSWVGQKKKEKNRDKRIGTGPAPMGGSCEGGKVSTH